MFFLGLLIGAAASAYLTTATTPRFRAGWICRTTECAPTSP